ncbi:MAG: DNA polymerase III subunit gamma/tau [Clostridia bacterium]|nr:DNA polymerase III subunit gamma/tau [Clostridia bacterium]
MSHLSLYRKFRPESFEGIVRQEHIVRILRNQIEKNAIGHAYLFTGPRGTGKTTIARIFARAVNCEQPQGGSPCGKCAVCRALQEGSLDITEIDAASNNGVNEMRDLREKVQYPPVSGRYKVYIVDEVHMLTDSAFNALLKTLEEPPAHAIFILATTEPQKIPATILSRCMRLDFKLIPEEDLEKHLKTILREIGKEYEEEAVAAIARAGAGSDRDMLSIAEACIVYSEKLTYEAVTAVLGAADFHETCKLVSAMLTADMPTALSVSERILSEGKSVGVLLKDILNLLSQVTVAKTCKTAERLLALPKELFKEVKAIAAKADGRAILRATEIFIKTENELRFVSSPRISLEAAIMRTSYPEADYDIEALLVRLNTLEARLAEAKSTKATAPDLTEKRGKDARVAEDLAVQKEARQEAEYAFPAEEPIFAEAYFSDEPVMPAPSGPRKESKPSVKRSEIAVPAPAPQIASAARTEEANTKASSLPQSERSAGAPQDAEAVYGKFLQALRKTARGALFAMCSDLIVSFEGDKFIFATESETVYGALNRENHRATMAEVLKGIGIAAFEVRKSGAPVSQKDAILELKKNFKDYPIEIK